MLRQIKERIIGSGRCSLLKRCRFLAMSVAAATVIADLAGSDLVPGLCHVQYHAVLIERLERERGISGNPGQKAGIRVAIRVDRLLPVLEMPYGNLSEDAQAFHGMVPVERIAAQRGNRPLDSGVGVRLEGEDSDGVDLAVVIASGVCSLGAPVPEFCRGSGWLAPGIPRGDCGYAARRHSAQGGAFPLI